MIKSLLLSAVLATASFAQTPKPIGFWPTPESGLLPVSRDYAWETITLIPSSPYVRFTHIEARNVPIGCSATVMAPNAYVFALGYIAYVILSCTPEALPGWYNVFIEAHEGRDKQTVQYLVGVK